MSKRDDLESVCTPIFSKEMGKRLCLMRMKLLMDQHELGSRLSIGQNTVSDLETGRIKVPRDPFSIAQLREVFEELTGFILYGKNPERFSEPAIHLKFWETKQKRRVKGGPDNKCYVNHTC